MVSVIKECMKMMKSQVWVFLSIIISISRWASTGKANDTAEEYSIYLMEENMKATGEKTECMVRGMKDYQMGRATWSLQTMETELIS